MATLKSLVANCIKCENFCDSSLFCDLCDKNARHSVTELCKKYNTKLHRISQFIFDLFVELYKCAYFVNSYHKRLKKLQEKNKTNSLQTDFTPLRNSKYCVLRHFASQMSLPNAKDMTSDDEEIDSTDHENEENSLKGVNLAGNRYSYGSYLSQTSSSNQLQLQYLQHGFQGHQGPNRFEGTGTSSSSGYYLEDNDTQHNYDYIDVVQQELEQHRSASKQDMRLHSSSEEHHSSDSWGRNNNNNDHEKNCKTNASINNNVYSEANWESSVGVANVAGSPWSREVLSSSTNGPSVPPNSYVDSNFQGFMRQNSNSTTSDNNEDTTQSSLSESLVLSTSNAIMGLQELEDLFNFEQTASLDMPSVLPPQAAVQKPTTQTGEVTTPTPFMGRVATQSVLLTETGDEKVKIPTPMTPQPQRRAANRNNAEPRVSTQPFLRNQGQYRSNFTPPPRPLNTISRKPSTESTSLFQSLARLWSRKKDISESKCSSSETPEGLIEPEFLVESVIKLYFKCCHKLQGNSLTSAECSDIRSELRDKLIELRIVLEGPQCDDMDEISFSLSKVVILLNKLFQKTLSKQEMNLIKTISQYLTKKWVESAFRMRSFNDRKTELFRKFTKVLDREL